MDRDFYYSLSRQSTFAKTDSHGAFDSQSERSNGLPNHQDLRTVCVSTEHDPPAFRLTGSAFSWVKSWTTSRCNDRGSHTQSGQYGNAARETSAFELLVVADIRFRDFGERDSPGMLEAPQNKTTMTEQPRTTESLAGNSQKAGRKIDW